MFFFLMQQPTFRLNSFLNRNLITKLCISEKKDINYLLSIIINKATEIYESMFAK